MNEEIHLDDIGLDHGRRSLALRYRFATLTDRFEPGSRRHVDGIVLSDEAAGFLDTVVAFAIRKRRCFYCGSELHIEEENDDGDMLISCRGCGWGHQTLFESMLTFVIQTGFLRASNIAGREEPLQAVASELVLNWEVVRQLHSSKLEEFVAAVTRGLLDCDVRIVGGPNDHGIDIIVLAGDAPVALQVKRRQRADHVEGVSVVREMCGAMIAEGFSKGRIVSTADHYSHVARRTADKILATSIITELSLIDCKELCQLFDLVRTDPERWSRSFHRNR